MMQNLFQKIIYCITWPYTKFKTMRDRDRRLKELRQKDPFIYK